MKAIKKLNQIDIRSKRVLIRADFNVPINGNEILSDFRIKASIKTIEYCIKEKSKIIIMSHLGRPDCIDKNLSLLPRYNYLKNILIKIMLYSQKIVFQKINI